MVLYKQTILQHQVSPHEWTAFCLLDTNDQKLLLMNKHALL